ncbi:MAG: CCA tRNA nucleotidyltransferase [Wolinella sp.]
MIDRFLSSLTPELLSILLELLELLEQEVARLDVYAVGGSVRDFLLGKAPKDLDIELHGITPAQFENLMQKIGAIGVGKSFFVYKWNGIDLSLPRCERKITKGHRGFSIEYASSPHKAALRRDFTVNALMLNLRTGEILDFFGGLGDIDSHTLRVVSTKHFSEDSLRVLRAARFCAQLDFKIAHENIALMREIQIDDLSNERIFLEIKGLMQNNPMRGILALIVLNLDEKIFKKTISRAEFWRVVREYYRFSKIPNNHEFAPFLPLFILHITGVFSMEHIVSSLPSMPKKLATFLLSQATPAHNISEQSMVRIACKYPLKNWLAIGDAEIYKMAKKLEIYDNVFTPACTPSMLLAEGFSGAYLGEELKKRCEAEILERFNS